MEETAQTTHHFIYFVVLLILLVAVTLMVFVGNLQELFSKIAEFFTPPSSQEKPKEDTGEISYFSLPITEDNTFLEKLRIFFEEFNVDYSKEETIKSYKLWIYNPFIFDMGTESFFGTSNDLEPIKDAIEQGLKVFNESNEDYDIKKVAFTENLINKEDIKLHFVQSYNLYYSTDCWQSHLEEIDFRNYQINGQSFSGLILYSGDGAGDIFEGRVKVRVMFQVVGDIIYPLVTICDDNT